MSKYLGDRVETALKAVGITPERVEEWVGAPCGCPERRDRLNQLDLWARRVVSGRIDRAREFVYGIIGVSTEDRPAHPEGED